MSNEKSRKFEWLQFTIVNKSGVLVDDESMDTRLLGQRLRELRLQRGVRQIDLARQLNISAAYLNLLEKGRRSVQLPILFRALEALDVDVERFMADSGGGHPDVALARLLGDPLARTLDLESTDLSALRAEPR